MKDRMNEIESPTTPAKRRKKIIASLAVCVFIGAVVVGVFALASLGLGVVLAIATGGAFSPALMQSWAILTLFLGGAWILRVVLK